MLNRFVICLAAIVLCAGLLLAHGDPILGTVTAVTNDTFTITVDAGPPEGGTLRSGNIQIHKSQ